MPPVTEQLDIDGSTQPDFTTTPIIVVDGVSAGGGVNGLELAAGSDSSTIRGLVINNFGGAGTQVDSSNNTIAGNWIGLEADGVTAAGNNTNGIALQAGSDNNTVGGTVAADRNVVSANVVNGLAIVGDSNLIIGNYFGTDSSGGVAGVGNGGYGIALNAGDGNTIGGTTVPSSNLSAGNTLAGIGIAPVFTAMKRGAVCAPGVGALPNARVATLAPLAGLAPLSRHCNTPVVCTAPVKTAAAGKYFPLMPVTVFWGAGARPSHCSRLRSMLSSPTLPARMAMPIGT